jgi:hypothetical protein
MVTTCGTAQHQLATRLGLVLDDAARQVPALVDEASWEGLIAVSLEELDDDLSCGFGLLFDGVMAGSLQDEAGHVGRDRAEAVRDGGADRIASSDREHRRVDRILSESLNVGDVVGSRSVVTEPGFQSIVRRVGVDV